MNRHYTKRKNKHLRLLLLMSTAFFFAGVKVLTHKSEPAATFAGNEFRGQPVNVSADKRTDNQTAGQASEQTEDSQPFRNLQNKPDESLAIGTPAKSNSAADITDTANSENSIEKSMDLTDIKPSQIIEMRNKLNQMLSSVDNSSQVMFIKRQLSQLADEWLFCRDVLAGDRLCGTYRVKPGDRLKTIGDNCKCLISFL